MAINDRFLLKCFQSGGTGEELLCTFGYLQRAGAGDPTFAELTSFVQGLEAAIGGALLNIESSYITWVRAELFMLDGPNAGLFAVSNALLGSSGLTGGTDGPIERALVMSKVTAFTGRKNRGRIFVPAPCKEAFTLDGAYVAGNPDAVAIAALATIMITDVTVLSGIALTSAILHGAGITPNANVYSTVNIGARVGSQRRRRTGIGA